MMQSQINDVLTDYDKVDSTGDHGG
jgi:hypothetical protein